MAWCCGSFSRSLISTARASSLRSPPPLRRLRLPSTSAPRAQSRRLPFLTPRNLGELGCTQSLLPLHSVVAATRLTSHLAFDVRACCEMFHGMNGKDG